MSGQEGGPPSDPRLLEIWQAGVNAYDKEHLSGDVTDMFAAGQAAVRAAIEKTGTSPDTGTPAEGSQ